MKVQLQHASTLTTSIASQIGPFASPEKEREETWPNIILGPFCLQNKKQAGTLSKPAMNALLLWCSERTPVEKKHTHMHENGGHRARAAVDADA